MLRDVQTFISVSLYRLHLLRDIVAIEDVTCPLTVLRLHQLAQGEYQCLCSNGANG